ncbi:hypothetical protein TY91_16720 [Secundilactobacillus collinoides]|uniref:Uncharacterized protein n=1 Tax=Secundilactobacillus collinoides TaxID=33960 RepID=A0A166FKU1_SECCO|nr:hypothetical protein TY91_16720 [Secundilactobacillus collinoides]
MFTCAHYRNEFCTIGATGTILDRKIKLSFFPHSVVSGPLLKSFALRSFYIIKPQLTKNQ